MMLQIGVYEARTHLARLLDQVEAGERVTITRHGKPVAMLVPIEAKPPATDTIEQLKSFRRGRRLEGINIRELIEEGRR